LLAISSCFFPSNHEWLKQYNVVGNFLMNEEDWQPDPDLATFIQSGPPPIVISLGSMMHDDPENLSQLFLETIKTIKCRAVIQSGWTGLMRNVSLPTNIYRADFIPHSWLFAQASCIVHHGGIGTTVAALRAGCPAVILPHAFDQFSIAQRTLESGCVSDILPLRELNIKQLGIAIQRAQNNPIYRATAQKMGKQIEADKGVQTARLLLEQFVTSTQNVNVRSTRG
jgi:sterol 3beta-glucosyltransferase